MPSRNTFTMRRKSLSQMSKLKATSFWMSYSPRFYKLQHWPIRNVTFESFFKPHRIRSFFTMAQASLDGKPKRLIFEVSVNFYIISGLEPRSYTSGRWLRNDKHERQARFIDLNFEELCQKVIETSNETKSIKLCERKEGGFNRVFIFTMDDDSRIVARLPFTVAGPARLTTASEVATIRYCKWVHVIRNLVHSNTESSIVQKNTSIPIPKILDWNDDPANSVGSEYIIMESAVGISLQQTWPYMPGDQKVKCIDAIYSMLRELVDIKFPAYGSLYLSTTLPDSFPRVPLNNEFCVGPHCGTRYWESRNNRDYQYKIHNQGPCEYIVIIIN